MCVNFILLIREVVFKNRTTTSEDSRDLSLPGPSCGSAGLRVHIKETNFNVKPRKKVKSQSPTQKKTEVIFFEDVSVPPILLC